MAKRVHDGEARVGSLPVHTRTVVFCGVGVVVARRGVRASRHRLSVAQGAHVPAHRIQCGVARHFVHTVHVFTCGQCAGLASGEFFGNSPPVQGELVFDGARGQGFNGQLVDVVAVVVGHLSARAAPAVEGAVQVHHRVRASVLAQVHLEGDVASFGATTTAATATGAVAFAAAVVTHHIQGGRFSDVDGPVHEAVDGAGARVAVLEHFLLTPPVQGEFVLVGSGGQINFQLVHVVPVVVGHHSASTAPSVESTVQVHLTVRPGIVVHVHLEHHQVLC